MKLWGIISLVVLSICLLASIAPLLLWKLNGVTVFLSQKKKRINSGLIAFFQFALTTTCMLIVLGIFLQVDFLKDVDLGLNSENVVMIDSRYDGREADAANFQAMRSEMLNVPGVTAFTSASHMSPLIPNYTNWRRTSGGAEPIEITVSHMVVDPDFLSTFDIPLLAGRNFSAEMSSELLSNGNTLDTAGILITKSGAERFGIASPSEAIGQTFRALIDRDNPRTYVVIGVIGDFKFFPSEGDARSIAVLQGTTEQLRSIVLRLNDSSVNMEPIENVWKTFFPAVPLNPIFMVDVMAADIRTKTQGLASAASTAFIVFLATAIFGIYAQATYVCEESAKSIAIRKILGSSALGVLGNLLSRFLMPVVCSFVVAVPLAMYSIANFYESFRTTAGYPVLLYLACLVGVIVVALVAVLPHCHRAISKPPILFLRYE